ncbi:MAG: tRNA (adenosine(37)-N6)-dimethylallyltransferase MiaA [Rhizobiales bacterium]|nr:tRNA (adenosine(37)-N6)-dimethylallyltransferase MiaA [Hyphomicrobiales bacterium]
MGEEQGAPCAILIAGPTASGKSAIALRLAERLGAVVVNADSMQVYSALSVLTARPSPADLARAPHRLYGHVAGNEAYCVGRYLTEVADVIREASARGSRIIVVGGTGLYFKALTEGLAPVPEIAPATRARWREMALRHGAATLHAELAARDPEMASALRPNDTQRLVRALEVYESTGLSLRQWQAQSAAPVLAPGCWRGFVLSLERGAVRARCDERLEAMLTAGALDEVRALLDLGLPDDHPLLRAVGVPQFAAHLVDREPLDRALERAKAATRQYAKRQMTWLRGNMMSWSWHSTQQMEKEIVRRFAKVDD